MVPTQRQTTACMEERTHEHRKAQGRPRMQQAKPAPAQKLVRAARQASKQPAYERRAEQAKQVEKQMMSTAKTKGHPRMQQAKPAPAQELIQAARQAGRQPPHEKRTEQARQGGAQHPTNTKCTPRGRHMERGNKASTNASQCKQPPSTPAQELVKAARQAGVRQ